MPWKRAEGGSHAQQEGDLEDGAGAGVGDTDLPSLPLSCRGGSELGLRAAVCWGQCTPVGLSTPTLTG